MRKEGKGEREEEEWGAEGTWDMRVMLNTEAVTTTARTVVQVYHVTTIHWWQVQCTYTTRQVVAQSSCAIASPSCVGALLVVCYPLHMHVRTQNWSNSGWTWVAVLLHNRGIYAIASLTCSHQGSSARPLQCPHLMWRPSHLITHEVKETQHQWADTPISHRGTTLHAPRGPPTLHL